MLWSIFYRIEATHKTETGWKSADFPFGRWKLREAFIFQFTDLMSTVSGRAVSLDELGDG